MKIPISWLKEYLPTSLSPEEIADVLTQIGLEVDAIVHEGDEVIFEIALTPNLAHAASIRGIARELAAALNENLTHPRESLKDEKHEPLSHNLAVSVENPEGCPHYACRLIRGVKVGPSPESLQKRLLSCNIRPINNVVDVTNLVLFELGQPLHAFDFDRIEGGRVIVRNAKQNEAIVTLDGKTHYPTEETLLICDVKKPIALAGIMGGQESEVTDVTTNVLIESAYFDPNTIRRAAKRMGIHTEASFRFERGVDPNAVLEALDLAAALIVKLAGGACCKGVIDARHSHFFPKIVSCRLSRVNQLLGTHLAMSEMETIFRRLNFEIHNVTLDEIEVAIPTYRHDIHQEIDLIEEVARLYGYDNIEKKEASFFRMGELHHSPLYLFEKKTRHLLLQEGLQELLTCDLISSKEAEQTRSEYLHKRDLITLLNPRSEEQSVLRPSLLPGLLKVIKNNIDHSVYSVSGYEIGKVHFKFKEQFLEPTALSIILTGKRQEDTWEEKSQDVNFFDLKGILENLLENLKIDHVSFNASHYHIFHPGRQSALMRDGSELGVMGQVHPNTLKLFGLTEPVFFAELSLDELMQFCKKNIKMQPLPLYPASDRDWTITLKESCPTSNVLHLIEENKPPLLESVSLLDLYRSEKLGSDRKNATFRFVYRDRNKTISVQAVENEHLRLTQHVFERLKEQKELI